MKVEYIQGKNGEWYFHFVGRNGEIVCQSEGYTRRTSARRAVNRFIASVKAM